MTASNEKGLAQLEKTLDLYLGQKAPALPKNIKDLIVSLAPWGNIALIVMALPALLAVLGITGYMGSMVYWAGARLGLVYYVSLAFLGLILVVRALAIPGLFSRSIKGWRLLYYSVLLNIVYSLFNYNMFSGLIGAVIGLYFLFQIKKYYK